MKGTIKPTAGILFILSVLIPGMFLGYFALRAVDREEVYIEKQFEDTLLADVMYAISVINNELKKINRELEDEFRSAIRENLPGDKPSREKFVLLTEKNMLIDIPFLVTEDFTLLWPDNKDEEFFHQHNGFLTNKVSIPVYQNIAIAYKEIIVNKQQIKNNLLWSNASDVEKNREPDSLSNETDILNEEYMNQNARIQFEQDEEVRDMVYEQAIEEGNELIPRSIVQVQKKDKKQITPESVFISRQLSFSEITQGQNSGLIPRIMENDLVLYFWTKIDSGYIAGCIIREEAYKDRLLTCIQYVYTRVRILTILDEDGIPLILPEENHSRNWRIPIVSREISEILPRWEVAAYLTDPDIITSRARSIALVMWVLIFLFIISIITGGILILKSFYSEIILAQQKTTFVSNVSHELKTPLTSIRLFAEMLKEERLPDRDKQKKYLTLMVSETERLSRLINNVLDFSKIGRNKKQYHKEKTDIIHLCHTLMEDQRLRLEQQGFVIEFSASKDKVMVNADSGSLKQALLNLIANAEKYSALQKVITLELITTDGYIQINIKDRGIGIPVKYAKKIFREFFRVDDSLTSRVRGSGLGLAIARKIITAHHGTIRYFPREGGGSIFQVTLPVLQTGGKNE
ncbi:MAG: HAMP domain-containing histidine kinase [Spirochaetales bacterium]|nr:HAMP domain-containing histidine kinase [Spirochaetales bacterium]